MKIEFDGNVVEQNLNIKGVKVRVKKCNDTEYQIWINDSENRFVQSKLPHGYEWCENNNITHYDTNNIYKNHWWSSALFSTNNNGYFKNGDMMNLEQVEVCINAVINGVNRLEEIYNTPEVIKIGNVEIMKKKIDENNVSLTITGLTNINDYPEEINQAPIVYLVDKDMILYDKNTNVVIINNKFYHQTWNFTVSNSDAEKVIEIITASEEKLARYKWEQENKDIKTHIFKMPGKNIEVKIIPEYDILFSINGQLPKLLGYKIYVKIPDEIRNKLDNELLECNVVKFNRCPITRNIEFRPSIVSIKEWYIDIHNVVCRTFSNGNIIEKEVAEEIFYCIEAYLKTWFKKQEEIKAGDFVKLKEYESDLTYKVIAVHNNEIWVQAYGINFNNTGIYLKNKFIKVNGKV